MKIQFHIIVIEYRNSKSQSNSHTFQAKATVSVSYLQRGSTTGGAMERFVGLSFEIPPARHFDNLRLQGFWVFSLVGNLLWTALQLFHSFGVGFEGCGMIFGRSAVCIGRGPRSARVKGGFSPVPARQSALLRFVITLICSFISLPPSSHSFWLSHAA